VETIVRGLAGSIPGARVARVEVLRPDLVERETADEFAAGLRGAALGAVTRRAKNIEIEADGGFLLVNLGMTGRLLLAAEGDPLASHPGVRFHLDGGRELRYHDARRFGRLWRFTPEARAAWSGALGVEPLSDEFTPAWLLEQAGRSRVAVKTWLMDQRRVVGVGNIYASEALFRARVDPRRAGSALTRPQAKRIVAAVKEVLQESIDFRGTTFLDYRDERGEPGEFARRLRVYDREGDPCTVCGTAIRRLVQGGRSTFFCPRCQR
jgi:formamidopyrimidine-DNA glycosylase